ncbi:MAG: SulP family inorganic anion transporter [Thermodesulfobacteria bacterium]|nr:SulP family inorganic anion transporter [Thermodesulfobacteriota bacterium]
MIKRLLPFLRWFDDYSLEDLRADFISGITVALVLIPQSMAYAQLAGLPPYYGLYASFLPPVVAALFGSSRQLSTGPVAVVSMMTAAALEPLAVSGTQGYIQFAILLALLVGLVQLCLGLLNLGVVVNLLSHPVLLGFTNAAAIVIATSQLGKFLGVPVEKAPHHFETVWRVIQQALDYVYWPTIALGAGALAGMIFLKWLNPRLPYVLIAVAITTFISYLCGYGHNKYVSINQIECKELPRLIDEFNRQLATLEAFNRTRTLLKPEIQKLKNQKRPCSRCHPGRLLTPDALLNPKNQGEGSGAQVTFNTQIDPKEVLALHLMAGVIDEFIADAKQKLVNLRARLMEYEFVEVREQDGSVRYYERYHVPYDADTDWHVWRIVAGNKKLDESRLVLSGGGSILGHVPRGLPSFSMPYWDADMAKRLLFPAFIISLVGFMEAISIAKIMAAKSGQRINPSQELIGQGLANITGSFFQGYAVSGSFSRSAVNFQSGARTGLSSVFASLVVVLVMLFLTPLLYYLPQSVLAAVIMMAVLGLINVQGVKHIFKVSVSDGIICCITFMTTLAFAPHLDKGVMIGVILSLGIFFYRLMRPSIAILSLWHDGHFRNADKFGLERCRHLAIIRFDGPFFFANIGYLEDEVLRIVRQMKELKAIIFKCNGINIIDASGEEALGLLVDRLRSAGYKVYFSGIKEQVLEVLERSSLYSKIGPANIFPTISKAIEAIWPEIHEGSNEKVCPLKQVVHKDAPQRQRQTKMERD